MNIFVFIYVYVICYFSLHYSDADNSPERKEIAGSRQTVKRLGVI